MPLHRQPTVLTLLLLPPAATSTLQLTAALPGPIKSEGGRGAGPGSPLQLTARISPLLSMAATSGLAFSPLLLQHPPLQQDQEEEVLVNQF